MPEEVVRTESTHLQLVRRYLSFPVLLTTMGVLFYFFWNNFNRPVECYMDELFQCNPPVNPINSEQYVKGTVSEQCSLFYGSFVPALNMTIAKLLTLSCLPEAKSLWGREFPFRGATSPMINLFNNPEGIFASTTGFSTTKKDIILTAVITGMIVSTTLFAWKVFTWFKNYCDLPQLDAEAEQLRTSLADNEHQRDNGPEIENNESSTVSIQF